MFKAAVERNHRMRSGFLMRREEDEEDSDEDDTAADEFYRSYRISGIPTEDEDLVDLTDDDQPFDDFMTELRIAAAASNIKLEANDRTTVTIPSLQIFQQGSWVDARNEEEYETFNQPCTVPEVEMDSGNSNSKKTSLHELGGWTETEDESQRTHCVDDSDYSFGWTGM